MKQVSHNLPKNVPNVIEEYLLKTKKLYEDPEFVEEYWNTHKNNGLASHMDKMIKLLGGKGKILDLGCGSGRDSKHFALKGLKVLGIDYSSAMINLAKSLHRDINNLEFIRMDMNKLDIEKNSFDGIWANASLLHIAKKKLPLVLGDLYSILKPSGILFVGVLEGRGEKFMQDTRFSKPIERFYSFYSPKQIEKVISRAGFSKIESYKIPSSTRPNAFWLYMFYSKV